MRTPRSAASRSRELSDQKVSWKNSLPIRMAVFSKQAPHSLTIAGILANSLHRSHAGVIAQILDRQSGNFKTGGSFPAISLRFAKARGRFGELLDCGPGEGVAASRTRRFCE